MKNLLDKLIELSNSDEYPMHMPGHKRNEKNTFLENAYQIDITEIEGYDNLYEPQGILKKAQDRATKVFHADKTYFLVNGSTVGNLIAVYATTNSGDKILMARNCHKSIYHAVELQQLRVRYLYPDRIEGWDIADSVNPQKIKEILEKEKDFSAVVITSPTYEGMISNIQEIATITHQYGIPLIVDEAHGAHFSFHKRFPKSANELGADIVIQSLHKTLPCFTQTALLHINGNLVNKNRIEKYLSYFQSSSPSYLLMAGIDECVNTIEKKGASLWHDFFEYRDAFMEETKDLTKIRIFDRKEADPCKLVISVKNTTMTGMELHQTLWKRYHIQMEMAASNYVVAIITQSDSREGFRRLATALKEIDAEIDDKKEKQIKKIESDCPIARYTIAEAMKKSTAKIALKQSVGKVLATTVNVYPPGIPLLVPGEKMTKELLEQILELDEMSFLLQGLELSNDSSAKMVRVIEE